MRQKKSTGNLEALLQKINTSEKYINNVLMYSNLLEQKRYNLLNK